MSKETAKHLNFGIYSLDPSLPEYLGYLSQDGKGGACYDTNSVPYGNSTCSNAFGSGIEKSFSNVSDVKVITYGDYLSNFKCYNPSGSAVECCPNYDYPTALTIDPNNSNNLICLENNTKSYGCDTTSQQCIEINSGTYSKDNCMDSCTTKYYCNGKELMHTYCDTNSSRYLYTYNKCTDNPNYEKFLPDPPPGIDYGTETDQVNPCDLTKQFVTIGDVKTPACAMINGWDCANTANNLGTQSGCAQAENHTKGCRRIDSSLFTTKIKNELAKELGGNTKQFATRSGDLGTDIKYHGEDTVNVPIGVKITGYSGIQPCSPNAGNFSAGIYDNFCGESQANFCEGEGKNLHNSANDMYYKDVPNIKIGADPSLYQGLKFELGPLNEGACEDWNTPDANGNFPYVPPANDGEVVIVPTPGGAGNDGSISCSDYCAGHTDNNYPICVDGYLALDDNLYTGGALGNEYYQRPYWYNTTFSSNLDVGCDGFIVPMAPGRFQNRSDVNYGFYKQICRCSNKQTN